MKRSEISQLPLFFDRYINIADDLDIVEALEKYETIEAIVDKSALEQLGEQVYADGKWTIKEIVQHITDNERVQAYRALRIARNDKTSLPGYDENLFAAHTTAMQRSLDDLLAEFAVVRRSNIFLFKSFTDQMQQRVGNCNNQQISVLALGFVLVGHQLHHCNIIRERYLPLLSKAAAN